MLVTVAASASWRSSLEFGCTPTGRRLRRRRPRRSWAWPGWSACPRSGSASITGPQVGAILNATFGNIAELIIAFFALQAGLIEVVKASITGSIIGNLLLVMGASVLVGGLRHGIQTFDAKIAGSNAALLVAGR